MTSYTFDPKGPIIKSRRKPVNKFPAAKPVIKWTWWKTLKNRISEWFRAKYYWCWGYSPYYFKPMDRVTVYKSRKEIDAEIERLDY